MQRLTAADELTQWVTSEATVSFTYASDGCLTTKSDGTDTWTYQWDYERRLKAFKKNGSTLVEYAYNPTGTRRYASDATLGVTNYFWSRGHVLGDYNSSWSLTRSYILGPRGGALIGMVDRTTDPNTSYYLTKDRLDSTRELVSASEAVMTRYGYDVWGTPTESHLSGSVSTRYRFRAAEASETGGYAWIGAVYPIPYDPEYGRWIASDQRWMRTRRANPAVWATAQPLLGVRGWYLPPFKDRPTVANGEICDGSHCLVAGCFNSGKYNNGNPCNASGNDSDGRNDRLMSCMRCCACAQIACQQGYTRGGLYTGNGSAIYCPVNCCMPPINPRECYQPCRDAGGSWRQKCYLFRIEPIPVLAVSILPTVPSKWCIYQCFNDDSGTWDKWLFCAAPVHKMCYIIIWNDERKCWRD